MKKIFVCLLHGGMLSVASPVILYVVNPDARIYIPPFDIYRSILFSFVLYLGFCALAYLVTRDIAWAGLTAALLVLGFLYLWLIFLIIVVCWLCALGIVRLIRKRVNLMDAHYLLNFLAIILAGFYLFEFSRFLARQPWDSYQAMIRPVMGGDGGESRQGFHPDIYYIVLDEYARSDVIMSLYDYDNSSFVEALEERGFAVMDDSQANYPRTVLSLSSTLNMQYLDDMASAMGDSYLWWPAEKAIHHSQVRQFLESQGYQSIFVASGFDYTDIRDGDAYLSPYPVMLNDFEDVLVRFTNLSVFGDIAHDLVSYPSHEMHRRLILHGYDALKQVVPLSSPKYVFAHILSPHPPFVFDENGEPLDPDYPYSFVLPARVLEDTDTYKKSYVAQLKFTNMKTLEAIDAIIMNSANPPVIILQSDHGPRLFVNYESLEDTCLYERFPILNAYYFPGVEMHAIPTTITPVNTFRLVFNAYFATTLDILPDRSYFSPSSHFYTFTDVTEDIQSGCQTLSEDRP